MSFLALTPLNNANVRQDEDEKAKLSSGTRKEGAAEARLRKEYHSAMVCRIGPMCQRRCILFMRSVLMIWIVSW
jgi:hypothetical protein